MTTLYKLTDQLHRTRAGLSNETQWGEDVEHSAKGDSKNLCSDGWIHAYTSPILAVILNPIHADIDSPILWEAEGEIGKSDGCKVGCRTLKTVRVIPLPKVTTEQWVKFSILCAKRVYKDAEWGAWADAWLSEKDRSYGAARAAAEAAAWAAAEAEQSENIDLSAIAEAALQP